LIYESWPWRDELLRVAARLEGRKAQVRWPEQSFYLVERDLMQGAFAVRRLIESFKVPDSVRDSHHRVQTFNRIGPVPDVWNRYELPELYDMEHPSVAEIPLLVLCNQVIHSWLFVLSFTEIDRRFDGVFIASDKQRRRSLYFVEIDVIVGMFRTVAEQPVVSMKLERNADGEMSYTRLLAPMDIDAGLD
jgi:hypothetical protein